METLCNLSEQRVDLLERKEWEPVWPVQMLTSTKIISAEKTLAGYGFKRGSK